MSGCVAISSRLGREPTRWRRQIDQDAAAWAVRDRALSESPGRLAALAAGAGVSFAAIDALTLV